MFKAPEDEKRGVELQAIAYHFHCPLHTFPIPSRALLLGSILYLKVNFQVI
jgi:hypothetical protein